MSNLRVYIAISTFLPIIGGAERQAIAHGRSLRAKGHDATIITLRYDRSWPLYEEVEGVPVYRVAGTLLGDRQKLPRALQQALYLMALVILGWRLCQWRRSYDILHVYQLTLTALPTALACWLTGKPMIIGVRSADAGKKATSQGEAVLFAGSLDPAAPWLRVHGKVGLEGDLQDIERIGKPAVRFTYALLRHINAGVTILSTYMKSYLAAYDFLLPDTLLIPNGVDSQCFTPACADNPSAERAYRVVCVSRLAFQKGIDVLLHAWSLVQEQCPQAHLLIVGTGPLQSQLERLMQELGLAKSVEFTGLQQNTLAQFHRAEISVLSSRWEGMPNALLEAMACGLACVATRVSGSEDIITPEVNGLLVEPEDHRSIAQALLTLLQNPDLVQKYGQAARLTIEEHYTLEHITDSYINFYHKIMKQRRQRTI